MRSSWTRLTLVVGLLMGGIVAGESTTAHASEGEFARLALSPNVSIVESIELPGQVVAYRTAGGGVVIGPRTIELVSLGAVGGVVMDEPRAGVGDRSTGWTDEAMSVFLDSVMSGRSLRDAAVEVEPLRASLAGPANELDTVETATCAAAESTRAMAKQCVKRQSGHDNGTEKFVGSAGYTWASPQEGEDYVSIRNIKNKHDYGSSAAQEIVDFNPKATVEQGSCGTYNVGVSGHGVSIGYSQTVCPDRLRPVLKFLGQEQFQTEWQGNRRGPTFAEAADIVKLASAAASKLVFSFEVTYRVDCSLPDAVCEFLGGP